MNFTKKVTVALDVANNIENQLKKIKTLTFLKDSAVDFVYISPLIAYNPIYSDSFLIYPIPEDHEKIRQAVHSFLEANIRKHLPTDFNGVISCHCLFAENPKKKFVEFATEHHSDLMIVFTREKHGIFESSFAQYLSRHSSTNMLLIKLT